MASFMNVDAAAMRNLVKRVGAGKPVLTDPFNDGRGREAVKIMRTGPKGVYRQFVDQTEYRLNTATPWKKGHDFGNRKAPRKTMLGSGLYRSAWGGGAGAIEKITKTSVELGVDSGLFPQVKIHQSRRPWTLVKPKEKVLKMGPNYGQWTMRWFFGLTYGIWMSNKRVGKGFKIYRRRVSVSSDVRKAVGKMLREQFRGKMRVGRLTTRASA